MGKESKDVWGGCCPINILTGIEAIRKRPGMYVGRDGNQVNLIVQEVIELGKVFGEVEIIREDVDT